jgi:hypothetical protein
MDLVQFVQQAKKDKDVRMINIKLMKYNSVLFQEIRRYYFIESDNTNGISRFIIQM